MAEETPPPPPPAGGTDGQPARPEFIQEKFWDATKGAPNVESLAKSYNELEGKFSKGKDAFKAEVEAERFKNRPAKPEEYAFVAPKDGPLAESLAKSNLVIVDKAPEKPEAGKNYLVINPKDPLLAFWREHAHKNGLGPDEFSAGVAQFAQAQLAAGRGIPSDEALRAAAVKSYDTLGEHGVKRAEHVKGQLHAIVGEDGLKALDFDFLPASAVATFEKLLEKAGGVKFSSGGGAAPGTPTLAELKAWQATPEYVNGDPAMRQKVADGYKALYPGQQQKGVV